MPPLVALAKIRISIPPEAVVPLAICVVTLLVLLFAGAALKSWKQRQPKAAEGVGLVLAVGLTGYVLYKVVMVMTEKYIDLGPPDHPPISLADGPILGFTTIMAALFWRFANLRGIALVLGVGVGVALIARPFVFPLVTYFSTSSERARVLSDPDTLSILGPGIVCLIAGLIVGLRKP